MHLVISFSLTFSGGQSNFSLGWDDSAQQQQQKKPAAVVQSPFATDEEQKTLVTSVKVHHAPGGTTSICLGDGTSGDDRF
jgi:hypothetical protein